MLISQLVNGSASNGLVVNGLVAVDPITEGGLLWTPLLIILVKVLVIFVLGLVGTMLMVWFERKVVSGMQNRVGPNKAGPAGLLQTLADGLKLFFKEDLLPNRADRIVFRLAPFLAFVPAFLVWAVIPLGGDFSQNADGTFNNGTVEIFGQTTRLQLADPPVGILLVLALSSIAVYGIMLAGWASGSKYPLLGSVRATAQMISIRSSTRAEPRSGAAVVTHTLDIRHRSDSGSLRRLESDHHRLTPVFRVRHRHHGRAEPSAVRPC
jgi:NADH-quinone oxidoreductase subunit H